MEEGMEVVVGTEVGLDLKEDRFEEQVATRSVVRYRVSASRSV